MTEKATFAAGCFWQTQEQFDRLKGVASTTVGYSGGIVSNPTYRQVCTGQTGHAESVQVEFDPKTISYEELLAVFWSSHDPTTVNKQGPDVGTQYRSIIFFHGAEQEEQALKSKAEIEKSGKFSGPVVTEIIPAQEFYRAEEYHQHYLSKQQKYSI